MKLLSLFFDSKTHKTCYTNSKLKTALIPIVGKAHVYIS